MSDPYRVPHVAWCEAHQKKGFTKKHARKVIRLSRRRGDTGSREYPCGIIPSLWHTGHLPLAVLEGLKTTREVYGVPPQAA